MYVRTCMLWDPSRDSKQPEMNTTTSSRTLKDLHWKWVVFRRCFVTRRRRTTICCNW